MVREYRVILDDPVSELHRQDMTDDAGLYFVFAAKPKRNVQGELIFALRKLLYIGRSSDVNRRMNGLHHRHEDILASCAADECPCYYYGRVEREDGRPCREDDYVRVESALIYGKQPLLNDTADRNFHHELTFVNLVRSRESTNRDPVTGELKALPVAFGLTVVVAI